MCSALLNNSACVPFLTRVDACVFFLPPLLWKIPPMNNHQRSFSVPVAIIAAGALFLEILDGTMLITAVPAIAGDFGVGVGDVGVVLVAYLAAAAAGIPVAGWMADRHGVRSVLLSALVVFTVASAACALAPDLTTLTMARIVQGLGGALLVPVGRLAVIRGTRPEDLLEAIAFLTWPALVAPVVAPVIGGILTDMVGWRWIFIINIPLGIIAVIVGAVILPKDRGAMGGRLDLLGVLGVMLVMVALTVSAELFARGDTRGVVVASVLIGSGVVATSLLSRWFHVPGRLFDLSVLAIPTFRVGNISGGIYRLVITAAPFLFTLLFQISFGWSATTAGLMVVALFVGNVVIKPWTSPIIRRCGFRAVLVASNIAGGLVLASFVFIGEQTPVPVILTLLLVSGAWRSLGFSAYNTLQFVDIGPEQTGNANVLSATLHQLCMSLGIAVAVLCHSVVPTIQWAFPLAALLFLPPLMGALALPADAGERAIVRSHR